MLIFLALIPQFALLTIYNKSVCYIEEINQTSQLVSFLILAVGHFRDPADTKQEFVIQFVIICASLSFLKYYVMQIQINSIINNSDKLTSLPEAFRWMWAIETKTDINSMTKKSKL